MELSRLDNSLLEDTHPKYAISSEHIEAQFDREEGKLVSKNVSNQLCDLYANVDSGKCICPTTKVSFIDVKKDKTKSTTDSPKCAFYTECIRIGDEYQATIPDLISPEKVSFHSNRLIPKLSKVLWSPYDHNISDDACTNVRPNKFGLSYLIRAYYERVIFIEDELKEVLPECPSKIIAHAFNQFYKNETFVCTSLVDSFVYNLHSFTGEGQMLKFADFKRGFEISEIGPGKKLQRLKAKVIKMRIKMRRDHQRLKEKEIRVKEQKIFQDYVEYKHFVEEKQANPKWCRYEIILLVVAYEKYGEDFDTIADKLKTKTATQVEQFFSRHRQFLKTISAMPDNKDRHSYLKQYMRDPTQMEIRNQTSNSSSDEYVESVWDDDGIMQINSKPELMQIDYKQEENELTPENEENSLDESSIPEEVFYEAQIDKRVNSVIQWNSNLIDLTKASSSSSMSVSSTSSNLSSPSLCHINQPNVPQSQSVANHVNVLPLTSQFKPNLEQHSMNEEPQCSTHMSIEPFKSTCESLQTHPHVPNYANPNVAAPPQVSFDAHMHNEPSCEPTYSTRIQMPPQALHSHIATHESTHQSQPQTHAPTHVNVSVITHTSKYANTSEFSSVPVPSSTISTQVPFAEDTYEPIHETLTTRTQKATQVQNQILCNTTLLVNSQMPTSCSKLEYEAEAQKYSPVVKNTQEPKFSILKQALTNNFNAKTKLTSSVSPPINQFHNIAHEAPPEQIHSSTQALVPQPVGGPKPILSDRNATSNQSQSSTTQINDKCKKRIKLAKSGIKVGVLDQLLRKSEIGKKLVKKRKPIAENIESDKENGQISQRGPYKRPVTHWIYQEQDQNWSELKAYPNQEDNEIQRSNSRLNQVLKEFRMRNKNVLIGKQSFRPSKVESLISMNTAKANKTFTIQGLQTKVLFLVDTIQNDHLLTQQRMMNSLDINLYNKTDSSLSFTPTPGKREPMFELVKPHHTSTFN